MTRVVVTGTSMGGHQSLVTAGLNPGKITALSDARHMTPQAIADWLAQWAK